MVFRKYIYLLTLPDSRMKNSPLQPFKLQLRWIEPWWSIDMEICTILSQVWRLWFKFEWSLFNWNTDNSAAVDIPYYRNHQDNRTLTNVHVTCKLMLYTSVPYFSFKIIHSNMLFIFFCFLFLYRCSSSNQI